MAARSPEELKPIERLEKWHPYMIWGGMPRELLHWSARRMTDEDVNALGLMSRAEARSELEHACAREQQAKVRYNAALGALLECSAVALELEAGQALLNATPEEHAAAVRKAFARLRQEAKKRGDLDAAPLSGSHRELEQKLEDLQAERDALLEELADPCASTDPLHPSGRCRCAGEGKCSFCLRMLALERAEAAEERLRLHEALERVVREYDHAMKTRRVADLCHVRAALKALKDHAQGSAGSVGSAEGNQAATAPSGSGAGTPTQPAEPAAPSVAVGDSKASADATANVLDKCEAFLVDQLKYGCTLPTAAEELLAAVRAVVTSARGDAESPGPSEASTVLTPRDPPPLLRCLVEYEGGTREWLSGCHAIVAMRRCTLVRCEVLRGDAPAPRIPQPGEVWRVKYHRSRTIVVESVHERERQVIDQRGLHWHFDEIEPVSTPEAEKAKLDGGTHGL